MGGLVEKSLARRLSRAVGAWRTLGAWLGVTAWFSLVFLHPLTHACCVDTDRAAPHEHHAGLARPTLDLADSCQLCVAAAAPAIPAAGLPLAQQLLVERARVASVLLHHGLAQHAPTVRGPPVLGC